MKRKDTNVQTASQIIGENLWLSKSFKQHTNNVAGLPVDNHRLARLVAPRTSLVIENTLQVWLGNMATSYGCVKTANKVWEALGEPVNTGFSQVGNHNHCKFPSSQGPDLNAFIDKFPKGTGTANTNFVKTDWNFGFTDADWVDWSVPTL
jgi:hypothetical protein